MTYKTLFNILLCCAIPTVAYKIFCSDSTTTVPAATSSITYDPDLEARLRKDVEKTAVNFMAKIDADQALEQNPSSYVFVSDKEQSDLQKADEQLQKDISWLSKIQGAIETEIGRYLKDHPDLKGGILNDDKDGLALFKEMFKLSVAGKILTHVENSNNEIYHQFGMKIIPVTIDTKGATIIINETNFAPEDVVNWQFIIGPKT